MIPLFIFFINKTKLIPLLFPLIYNWIDICCPSWSIVTAIEEDHQLHPIPFNDFHTSFDCFLWFTVEWRDIHHFIPDQLLLQLSKSINYILFHIMVPILHLTHNWIESDKMPTTSYMFLQLHPIPCIEYVRLFLFLIVRQL